MRVDGVQGVQGVQATGAGSPPLSGEQRPRQEAAQPAAESHEAGDTALREAVRLLNESALVAQRRVEFRVHEGTNRIMVRVVHSDTDELIREIPPEQVLNMVAKVQEIIGLLVDERA